ncbi:unnamed protein product, partial [Closterium sp. NIES-53]
MSQFPFTISSPTALPLPRPRRSSLLPLSAQVLLEVLRLGVRSRGVRSLRVLGLGVLSLAVLRLRVWSLGVLSRRVRSLGVWSLGLLLCLEVRLVLRRDCLRSSCVSGLFVAHAFGLELPELEALETL